MIVKSTGWFGLVQTWELVPTSALYLAPVVAVAFAVPAIVWAYGKILSLISRLGR